MRLTMLGDLSTVPSQCPNLPLLVNVGLTTLFPMTTLLIETRRAGLKDSAGIAHVHEVSWQHAYTGLIPHGALRTMIKRRNELWWARAIRNSTRILVMQHSDEIVGYATLGANRVSALPQDGEVYELYLLPQYQGIGLGRQLFIAAREELLSLGMKGCIVWVLEDNHNASHFYINAGGKDVAEGTETFNDRKLNKIAFAWD